MDAIHGQTLGGDQRQSRDRRLTPQDRYLIYAEAVRALDVTPRLPRPMDMSGRTVPDIMDEPTGIARLIRTFPRLKTITCSDHPVTYTYTINRTSDNRFDFGVLHKSVELRARRPESTPSILAAPPPRAMPRRTQLQCEVNISPPRRDLRTKAKQSEFWSSIAHTGMYEGGMHIAAVGCILQDAAEVYEVCHAVRAASARRGSPLEWLYISTEGIDVVSTVRDVSGRVEELLLRDRAPPQSLRQALIALDPSAVGRYSKISFCCADEGPCSHESRDPISSSSEEIDTDSKVWDDAPSVGMGTLQRLDIEIVNPSPASYDPAALLAGGLPITDLAHLLLRVAGPTCAFSISYSPHVATDQEVHFACWAASEELDTRLQEEIRRIVREVRESRPAGWVKGRRVSSSD